MKKTTYILLGLILFSFVGSFFLPAALFTESEGGGPQTASLPTVQASNSVDTVHTAVFHAINVDEHSLTNVASENPTEPLSITVIESSAVESPVIVMDKAWKDNVSFTVENNVLMFSVDMHGFADKETKEIPMEIMAKSGSSHIAEIIVPEGILMKVAPRYIHLNLVNFKNARMGIEYSWNGVTMTDCSFSDFYSFD